MLYSIQKHAVQHIKKLCNTINKMYFCCVIKTLKKMKIEITEISANELLNILSAMNYFDVSKLLAEAISIHAEKVSDNKEMHKSVCNELVRWCEPLIFEADMVKDVISDSLWQGKHPYKDTETETDIIADITDCQADDIIKQAKGE